MPSNNKRFSEILHHDENMKNINVSNAISNSNRVDETQIQSKKLKPQSFPSLSQAEGGMCKESSVTTVTHSKLNSNPHHSSSKQPNSTHCLNRSTTSDEEMQGQEDCLSPHQSKFSEVLGQHQTPHHQSNFPEVLGELGQEAKMILLQYSQTFRNSQAYEQQSVQAVLDLTSYAQGLEQRLLMQKDSLCSRLKTITKHLKNES